ncbi:ParA family protein [Scatolibacter rhodanostii]|uniref:ParA family protein n=1 Tax=Scatolibacter rhodanostii TaxID=2014781 RepID=UPI000C087337|nr:ParA family protein [Scatolibacter rhodanostii]
MAKIISLINEKGGVGKTTSTNLIATCLKHKNFRVLCIDFDPQGHLSFSMGADTRERSTIYDVLKRTIKPQYAIQHTAITDIIPANDLLKSIEREFTNSGNEQLLKNCIKSLSSLYDYILIDSPPELGLISANALVASDIVLIPCLPDGYSLMGAIKVHDTIMRIKRAFNPELAIGGVFLVRYYSRENLSRSVAEVLTDLTEKLDITVLQTKIRHSNVINSATTTKQLDAIGSLPKNNAVLDYQNLVDELFERGVL